MSRSLRSLKEVFHEEVHESIGENRRACVPKKFFGVGVYLIAAEFDRAATGAGRSRPYAAERETQHCRNRRRRHGLNNIAACAQENIVALCNVDAGLAAGAFGRYPHAKQYKDFRVMLDQSKDIDAVIVATPITHMP